MQPVTRYQASDGTLHETAEACERYEAKWELLPYQLSAVDAREAKVDAYLARMSSGSTPDLGPAVAFAGKAAWKQILQSFGTGMIWCDAYINDDGELFFTWQKDRRNLELRITKGCLAEFAFCDLTTGSDEGDFEDRWFIGEAFPLSVLAVVPLFANSEPTPDA